MDESNALAIQIAIETCGGEHDVADEALEVVELVEEVVVVEEVGVVEVVLEEVDPEESSSMVSESELEELEDPETCDDLEEVEDGSAAITEW